MMDDRTDPVESNQASAPDSAASEEAPRQVATRIEEIPAADGADVMETLPKKTAADVAEYLDPNTAGGILAEMDPALAASVIADMQPPEASMVLSAMEPDDRVDIIARLPGNLRELIIGEMNASDAADVRRLEQYPPDT